MDPNSLVQRFLQLLPQAWQALRQQQYAGVEAFLAQYSLNLPQWRQLALELAISRQQLATAEQHFAAIRQHEAEIAAAALRMAQFHLAGRRRQAAREAIALAEQQPLPEATFYRALAAVHSALDDPERALPWLEQAIQLTPADAALRSDLALCLFFLNRMDEATEHVGQVLATLPEAGNVLHLRSALKTATAQHNHVADLQQRLRSAAMTPVHAVGAGFALAKELEDLGEFQASFAALKQAADSKRQQLRYDASAEFALFADMRQHFDATFTADCRNAPAVPGEAVPVFILGMPRTGTTLVERILGQHPQVRSIGEFPDFPQELAQLARQQQHAAPQQQGSMIAAALRLDYAELGRRYLRQAQEVSQGAQLFIDKLPFNFMYGGLIKKALPQARIIHLVRDPLDTCFAVYKTLFNQVYSFSYQLEELADYYIEYRKLMAHWHQVMPGLILDVHYEHMVAAPEAEARRILNWCDLPWQDDVLEFHRAKTASTTASAAQVRQPIHQRSVQKWRQFANELAPVRQRLEAAGIIDEDGNPL